MYEYVKTAKRGGVSSVSRRFECSKDGFDVIKTIDKEFIESLNRQRNDCPDTILYIDSTNLYGRIQCERLPIRSYDFLDKKELKYFDLFMKTRSANYKNGQPCISYQKFFNNYFESNLPQKLDKSKDEKLSFLVEADIKCDEKLHSYMKGFPVPADKYKISPSALSQKSKIYKEEQEYGKKTNETRGPAPSLPAKLCLTLLPKIHFKSTLEHLLLLTEIGYEVTQVHSVLRSVSSPFLKSWVLHNTGEINTGII